MQDEAAPRAELAVAKSRMTFMQHSRLKYGEDGAHTLREVVGR